MNRDILNFLKKHDMDFNKLSRSQDSSIATTKDINQIISSYGFYSKEEDAMVSIGDIVGYNHFNDANSKNIFSSFDNFFNSNGQGYHRRSLGMLEYSNDEIINKLSQSFKVEPMNVSVLTNNNHVISTNGLHRYTVLRAHYINESYGVEKGTEEYFKIKDKYKIPVKLQKIDLIKTYSNFLLANNPDFKYNIKSEINNNYEYTGNVILQTNSDERLILNDEDLLAFLNQVLENTQNPDYFDKISRYCNMYNTFRFFMDANFSNISNRIYGGRTK